MDKLILSALDAINVAELPREDWLRVGMALKEEGYPADVWDAWSRNDQRYKEGECFNKWTGFKGAVGRPVKAGTIIQMARERFGWKPYGGEAGILTWDSPIEYDGDERVSVIEWTPAKDLRTYLTTLFEPKDIVAYVTGEARQDPHDGKWKPSGTGVYNRTCGELLKELDKHPDDLGAVVGDWKPDAGAWIRINPFDGKGVKDANVKAFRYALVECDTIPIAEQDAKYRELQLPIACMVHSGGKSLHAIVHIDAKSEEDYDDRVRFLFKYLEDHGLDMDKGNANPSRLSRMPGITRGQNRQWLVATNIGRTSWADWMEFVEEQADVLPGIESLESFVKNPPELPEEMIGGVLRRGHKMLISGPSKAGKSFLLMNLCICLAEGIPWLDRFPCKKSRVLYVNLEIDPASAINRFLEIYKRLGIKPTHASDIMTWGLRGHAIPLDKLVPRLVRRVKDMDLDVIVIDPIYKVITGDENNASEMGAFCNQFDRISTETNCSVIYCHHHSKGAQGAKKAMDRASGSGVFARDPDAQLDLIQLELTNRVQNTVADDGVTAWRLECSLREFENFKPINIWFDYPVHYLDHSGELDKMYANGDPKSNLQKSSKRQAGEEDWRAELLDAVQAIPEPVTVTGVAEWLGVSNRTVQSRINKIDELSYKNGVVYWTEKGE